MARMFNPPHPGLTLRDDVLPALRLSVTEAAQQLDVNRVTLSRVLLRMAQSGMFGQDAAELPVPDAGWLVSLDEAERWLLAKEHKVDFDGIRGDLEIMRRDGLDDWPT